VDKNIMDMPAGSPSPAAPQAVRQPQPGMVTPTPGTANTGSYLDAEMVQDIEKVIDRRTTTPFAQLRKSAEMMKSAGLDESTRYKAAFAMLSGQGVNAQQVIQSIDVHIRDIETEKTNFESSSTQNAGAKVTQLRAEVDNLNAQQQNDQALIQRLQEQIQSLQRGMGDRAGVITQKTMEATTAETQIATTVNKFKAAADSVIASLNMKKTTLSSTLA
jgi:uncharacterized protein (DUF3084 family)